MHFTSSVIQSLACLSLLLHSTFFLFLPGQAVVEAAPSNDICANATPIAIGSTIEVNTSHATSASDGGCYDENDSTRPGVWYTFIGTGKILIVGSCPTENIIEIFSDGCNPARRTCVAVTYNSCNDGNPLGFFGQSGTTYYLLFQTQYEGLFNLSLFQAPRPILIGGTFGDPHILTMDNFFFDCQARGEFTMLKSIEDTSFHIQARFTKATTSGIGTSASVTSGIVINETNASSIQVSFEAKNASTVQGCFDLLKLYVSKALTPLINGTNYINVSVTILNNEEIVLMYNSGLEVHLFVRVSSAWGCYLAQWIVLRENYRVNETLTGLLGNANIFEADDWQTKNGVTLPIPDNGESFFQDEFDYCRTEWCLRNVTDSLFTYGLEESFAMYFECDEPYNEGIKDAVEAETTTIYDICNGFYACIIDGVAGTVADTQNFWEDVYAVNTLYDQLYGITLEPSPETTTAPSPKPITAPTRKPTKVPSRKPSKVPTFKPTPTPILKSTSTPILIPTPAPTLKPCGLFRNSRFCPFAALLRFLRNLFGL